MEYTKQTKIELIRQLIELLKIREKQLRKSNTDGDYMSKTKSKSTFGVLFPTTYGNTRFESMEDVKKQKNTNPDALGLYSQCSLYGAGTKKIGMDALDGLFESASKGCSDSVLFLARMYEYGMAFTGRDMSQALNLYKYAYSLENVDALHSLGYILFNSFEKKEIGLSMMRKSAELGSRGAKFHLSILEESIQGIEEIDFESISSEEFEFSKQEADRSTSLYSVNLDDRTEIKNSLLKIMNKMKPQTYSVIMNEFRKEYLRGRDMNHFEYIDFRGILEELVEDGVIEKGGVGEFGVTEDTIYISRASTQKMKTTILEGDDWDI